MPTPPVSTIDSSHHEMWAEVRAHDRVMRYRRCGSGYPVLVLCDAACANPVVDALRDALGAAFRFLVPDIPGAVEDFAAWLADFLEGVGVGDVAIVAVGELCVPALELALGDGDQVARVVLLPGPPARANAIRGVLATAVRHTAVPLLVVRSPVLDGAALEPVGAFLDASTGDRPT